MERFQILDLSSILEGHVVTSQSKLNYTNKKLYIKPERSRMTSSFWSK